MRAAMCPGRVPDIVIGRRDVEIAPEDERAARIGGLVEPPREPLEPAQLALVPGRIEDATVGCVEAHHADTAGHGADHAGLGERVEVGLAPGVVPAAALSHGAVTEVADDGPVDADPTG